MRGRIVPVYPGSALQADITQDFGPGFYCGSQKYTAVEWTAKTARHATITSFDIDEAIMDDPRYRVHRFADDLDGSIEWALFVACNRGWFDKPYHNLDGTELRPEKVFPNVFSYFNDLSCCDVIIGHIADDKIQESFNSFMDCSIGIAALNECLKASNLGIQYVFKTQAACNILNDKCRSVTKGFQEFLRTDPGLSNMTAQQIIRQRERKFELMKSQISVINRRYWNAPGQINFEEALSRLEDMLRSREEEMQFDDTSFDDRG